MNVQALRLLADGEIEKAVSLLAGTNNAKKKRAVRNTILVMSQLDDDQWDGIDDWAEKKLRGAIRK